MWAAILSRATSFNASTESVQNSTLHKRSCRTSTESSPPWIVSPSLRIPLHLWGRWWGHWPLCNEPTGPKSKLSLEKAAFQGWRFLSCSGLWWSSPWLARRSWGSSACWGHARAMPGPGLLGETGMFAGLRLRHCIDFQQAASSIYVKALLVQFKPCLSWALCSNTS